MKALLPYTLLACVLALLSSCNKENELAPSQAFLHLIDVNGMYISRGAVAMPDGSTIVGSVGFENPNIPSLYGQLPSLLTKLDPRGRQLWQVDLPMIVHELWACHLLSTGNILVVGFENLPFPERLGVAIISPDGEVLHTLLIPNQTIAFSLNPSRASVSALELSTGVIALALPTVTVANSLTRLRLIQVSHSLEIIEDRVYPANQPIPPSEGIVFPSMQEDAQGNLVILSAMAGGFNNPRPNFALCVKLLAPNYDPDFVQLFAPAENMARPSNMALSTTGEAVWASTGLGNSATPFEFNLRYQEAHIPSRSFSVWKSNGNDDDTAQKEFDGYPKLGFIQSVSACSDGGFILAGTCNIDESTAVPSAFRIMLIKLNAQLELEWMRLPTTDSPSFGAQAWEIPGGYLVSATNLPSASESVPFVFKTNNQGIIL